jgi:hypothetical protein
MAVVVVVTRLFFSRRNSAAGAQQLDAMESVEKEN